MKSIASRLLSVYTLTSLVILAILSPPPAAGGEATDLALSGKAEVAVAVAGEPLRYLLTVQNLGPVAADATEIMVALPPEVSLIETSGCQHDPSGLPDCDLRTLEDGETAEVAIDVLVSETARGTTLTLEAKVRADDPDSNPANNMLTILTPVSGETVVAQGSSPAIASDPTSSESFAVGWLGSDDSPPSFLAPGEKAGAGGGIRVQLFSSRGVPVGVELRLDQSGASHALPDLARRADGEYVAVWQSQDSDGEGVFGRLFSSVGTPVGVELRLNSFESRGQSQPAVAGLGDGRFLTAWSDEESLGSFVRALRLFSAVGTPIGVELRFGASDIEAKPPSAAASGERILVTWEDAAERVAGHFFDLDGTPIGVEFHIAGAGQNAVPRAAPNHNGFVVVWQNDSGADLDGSGIFGRRWSSVGTPIGVEFRVNLSTSGDQQRPAIARAPDGTYVVTWQGPDGDGNSIFSRRLSTVGVPVGVELRLSRSNGDQTVAEPAFVDTDGTYYVAWQDDEGDDSEIVILPPGVIFGDGFESGDFGNWDLHVQQ